MRRERERWIEKEEGCETGGGEEGGGRTGYTYKEKMI